MLESNYACAKTPLGWSLRPLSDTVQRLLEGDQRILSRTLSMLERGDPAAATVMREVDHLTGRAYTIGITGPPGVGKSTIVDRLTELLRSQGLSVGIVAVDPTSPFSGGALLGDRIRMQRHYLDSQVFIRSVATRGQSGGLPRIVKSMARLLDASSKDVVLVETVGVGQTELGIMGVADTVLVTLMPESGDGIQTLKAGVMEIADIFVVNKADREGANRMAIAVRSMLQTSAAPSEWEMPVVLTSAHAGEGIEELWEKVQEHRKFLTDSANLEARRESRRRGEFLEAVQEELSRRLKQAVENHPGLVETTRKIADREAEPYSAAMDLLESMDSSINWLSAPGSRP